MTGLRQKVYVYIFLPRIIKLVSSKLAFVMNLPLVGKCLRILGILHCMLMPMMWAQDMPDVSIEVWGGERPKSYRQILP